jgi:hypothetical protein
LALHHALRLGDRRVCAELRRLAAGIEGELFATFAAHAAAEQRGDAAGLDEVSMRFEAIGARVLAAEVAASASLAYANARSPHWPRAAWRAVTSRAAWCCRCAPSTTISGACTASSE